MRTLITLLCVSSMLSISMSLSAETVIYKVTNGTSTGAVSAAQPPTHITATQVMYTNRRLHMTRIDTQHYSTSDQVGTISDGWNYTEFHHNARLYTTVPEVSSGVLIDEGVDRPHSASCLIEGATAYKSHQAPIMGHEVVAMHVDHPSGGAITQYYLAPDLDCLLMRKVVLTYMNSKPLITVFEAIDIETADAAESMFDLPKGYHEVEPTALDGMTHSRNSLHSLKLQAKWKELH